MTSTDLVDSRIAWLRLAAALALSTIGGVGMWSVVVALPAIQADFGVTRAAASFPYTLMMLGFGVGGIVMGRLSDRYGVRLPLVGATCVLALGYVAASMSSSLLMFAIAEPHDLNESSGGFRAPVGADLLVGFEMIAPDTRQLPAQ